MEAITKMRQRAAELGATSICPVVAVEEQVLAEINLLNFEIDAMAEALTPSLGPEYVEEFGWVAYDAACDEYQRIQGFKAHTAKVDRLVQVTFSRALWTQ